MQLAATIELWEYHHPESNDFFQDFVIDARIDRELLKGSILYEIGGLECVDWNSECLWKHFDIFFRKWEIPIKQLLNTAEYEYNPMLNVDYQINRNLGKNVVRDLGKDIVRELTSAIKQTLEESKTHDEGTSTNSTRKITDDYSDTKNNTHSDTDTGSETVDGTLDVNETVIHAVSAFDQIDPKDSSTFHDSDRTTRDESSNKKTDSTDTNTGNWNETTKSDNVRDDVLNETGTKDITLTTNQTDNSDRKDDETTNTTENEQTDTKESEGTHKEGIDGVTNQSLIEQQRKVVVFNVLNWIVDKVAKEFVVGVW